MMDFSVKNNTRCITLKQPCTDRIKMENMYEDHVVNIDKFSYMIDRYM